MRERGGTTVVAAAALVGMLGTVPACGGVGGGRITAIGVPSADLPVPPTPDPLTEASCTTEPDRGGVGQWRTISTVGAPAGAENTVWTGSEMIVVNTGRVQPVAISAYDPVLDSWRDISVPTGVTLDRTYPFVGFVGRKLVIYGGRGINPSSTGSRTDGWTIDVASGEWTAMADGPPIEQATDDTGQRVVPAGTRALFLALTDGDNAAATYDLATGEWASVSVPVSTPGGGCMSHGWNGTVALCGSLDYLSVVSPHPLAVQPFPTRLDSELSLRFAAIGDRFFAWGSPLFDPNEPVYRTFWIDPGSRNWGAAPTASARRYPVVATVGNRIVVWGGFNAAGVTNDGAVFDPTAGTWSPITCVGAPPPTLPYGGDAPLATSTGLIVFHGAGSPYDSALLEL